MVNRGIPLSGPIAALKAGLEASVGETLPEFDRFLAATRQIRLRRGEELFPAGVRHPYLYQLTHGVMRLSAINTRGQSFNLALVEEGELVASVSAILPPSVADTVRRVRGMDAGLGVETVSQTRYAAHAVTEAYVLRFDANLIGELASRHMAWSRLLLANIYIFALLKETRQHEQAMLTVEERYIRLMRERPTLVARVTKRDLAAYLGMTPESFSRMLQRLRDRGVEVDPPAMHRPQMRAEVGDGFWSRSVV